MTSPPTAIRGGGLADEPELEAETSLGRRDRGRAAGVRRPRPATDDCAAAAAELQKRRTVPERAVAGARAHAVDSTVAELAALASGQKAPAKAAGLRRRLAKVRKTPSWPRSWANFNFLSLYPRRNAWANLHRLGQPNTFLAQGAEQGDRGRDRERPGTSGRGCAGGRGHHDSREPAADGGERAARSLVQLMTGVKTLGEFSSLLSTRRAQFPYGNWIYRGLERIPDEVLESALEAHCKQYIVCTKSTMARTEHTRAHTRPGCALTASRRGAPTSAAPAPCSRRHPPSRR